MKRGEALVVLTVTQTVARTGRKPVVSKDVIGSDCSQWIYPLERLNC